MSNFFRPSNDGVEIDKEFKQNPVINLEMISHFVKSEHGGLLIGSKKYPIIEFAGTRVMWYYETAKARDGDYDRIAANVHA